MTRAALLALIIGMTLHGGVLPGKKKAKTAEPSLLDQYVKSASDSDAQAASESLPGAIWGSSSRLNDLARDLRASQVNDVVTVIVTESVNAVAGGGSSTQRSSSANSSLTKLAGMKSAAGGLTNLLGVNSDQKLNGTGTTSRTATLTATLTARVVRVMPGGLLLIEGDKSITVNSEQQVIRIRGIVRTPDISTANTVPSTQVADLEVQVNGKGIVGDAVRRPNALYRLLLGLLPF
jgi:flagellar L-ring protein FlgH